jgi:tetratricopeptide (TPR) repeat protein
MKDKTPENRRTKKTRRSSKNKPPIDPPRLEELRKQFNILSDNQDWNAIINIIEPLLNRDNPDHWLLVQLAAAYHEKGDYGQALIHSAEAMWVEYDCPLARWVFAYALLLRGQFKEAIDILEEYVQQTPGKIHHGECGEGTACNLTTVRAESIINDARLVMGFAYKELGYSSLFRYYRDVYKRHVDNGCDTVFPEHILSDEDGED